MNLEKKIQKYTYKLNNTNSLDKANLYQKKLRHYHNLNQEGGVELNEKLNQIEKQFNKIGPELTQPTKLDELNRQVRDLSTKVVKSKENVSEAQSKLQEARKENRKKEEVIQELRSKLREIEEKMKDEQMQLTESAQFLERVLETTKERVESISDKLRESNQVEQREKRELTDSIKSLEDILGIKSDVVSTIEEKEPETRDIFEKVSSETGDKISEKAKELLKNLKNQTTLVNMRERYPETLKQLLELVNENLNKLQGKEDIKEGAKERHNELIDFIQNNKNNISDAAFQTYKKYSERIKEIYNKLTNRD